MKKADDDKTIARLEKAAGYIFRDRALLLRALTHSSRAYEAAPDAPEDNEVLEFLGDAVIGLFTAEYALAAYPGRHEGELSKLKASATSTLALAELAQAVKLDKAVRLGRGEEKSGGRKKPSILAGTFEALAGAIYLDGGFEAAKRFVSTRIGPALKPIKTGTQTITNAKSALQEICQKAGLAAPDYRLLSEKGPAHSRTFVVEVRFGEKARARARGASKKTAEQAAAEKALRAVLGRKLKRLSSEAFVIEADDLALP